MVTIETDPAREVLNQAPRLQPIDLFGADLALQEALEREGGGWGVDRVREAGAVVSRERAPARTAYGLPVPFASVDPPSDAGALTSP